MEDRRRICFTTDAKDLLFVRVDHKQVLRYARVPRAHTGYRIIRASDAAAQERHRRTLTQLLEAP